MIVPDNEANRERASTVIAAGGLVAFRTDTFYGLGVDPFNRKAIKRILEIKGREQKPILLLISRASEVDRFIENRSEMFDLIARSFWPGPLTIVGNAKISVPTELTAGTGTIGLRLPADDKLCELLRLSGGALTATSANPSGALPARSAEEVETYFSSEVDLIIDGGETFTTSPSTVIDVSQQPARIVREGAISRARLESVLPEISLARNTQA